MKKNTIRLVLLSVVAMVFLTMAAIRLFADIPSYANCPLDGEISLRDYREPCTVSPQNASIVCTYSHSTGYNTEHRFYMRVQ